MADSRATLTSGQIGVRIIYDVEGLIISSSDGVVTNSTPKKVPRNVLPSSYPWTSYILSTGQFQLDANGDVDTTQSEFWDKFLGSFPQPNGGDLGSQALPWLCEWRDESATFYQTDTTNVITKLPDAQFVDVYITKFKNNIPLKVEYYDAITKSPLPNYQATEIFDCNMPSSTHQWDCSKVPSGYYAASATWKDKDFIPTGFNSFTLADLPILYNVRGTFATNNHISRTLRSNQPYTWTEGNTTYTVSTCYRNASTMQTMAVLYYTYVKDTSISKPTMIVYCNINKTAPTKYTITYKHNSSSQEILATNTKTSVYLTKDFKTSEGKTLYQAHLNEAKTALEAYDAVPSRDDSVLEIETKYNEAFPNEAREVNAVSLVQAKYLIISAQGSVADSTNKIVNISNQQYEVNNLSVSTLFPTPKQATITNADGVSTEAYLDRGTVTVNSTTLSSDTETIDYQTLFNKDAIAFSTVYSLGQHTVTLQYMLQHAATDSTGKHYYQSVLDGEIEVGRISQSWDMTTDNLRQSIANLVGLTVGDKWEGDVTVYVKDIDCSIQNSKVQPSPHIVSRYKTTNSWFTIANIDELNSTLNSFINDAETTLKVYVNLLQPISATFSDSNVKWALSYQNGKEAGSVNKGFTWILYPELTYTYRDLFESKKDIVSFENAPSSGDWNIKNIWRKGYSWINDTVVNTTNLPSYSKDTIALDCIKKFETVKLKINQTEHTLCRDGSPIYPEYTYIGDKKELTVSKDLSLCTMNPLFSGGKLIFVSEGPEKQLESSYSDFPETGGTIPFITLTGSKHKYIYKGEALCNKAINVDSGMSVWCRHIKLIDAANTNYTISSYLTSKNKMLNNSDPKRNFIIGFVGAGGGGGGGKQVWPGNYGGSGGGSGGSGAWHVHISSDVVKDNELSTLRIRTEGGVGGGYGGEGENGQDGSEMIVKLEFLKNGSWTLLVEWKVPAGKKGKTNFEYGGVGGEAPDYVTNNLGSELYLHKIYAEPGATGMRAKEVNKREKTSHEIEFTSFIYTDYAWMGVQMEEYSNLVSYSPSGNSLRTAYNNGTIDSLNVEKNINTLLSTPAEYQNNTLCSLMYGRLPTNNNSANGKNSNNNRGGCGAASVLGVCTQFQKDSSGQYANRPNPGCGGCGGGRWDGTVYKPRQGGNGAVLIFC